MGQFEKIVVLVALLLVTVILAVTFTTEEDRLSIPIDNSEEARLEAGAGELLARDRTGEGENARTRRERQGAGGTLSELAGDPEDAAVVLGDQPSGPGGSAIEVPEPLVEDLGIEQLGLEALTEKDRAAEPAGDLLLDDSFDPNRQDRVVGLPEGAALRKLTGLRDTWEPDLKEYVWRNGDTWPDVAETYYGDRRKVELLRQFNEGLSAPKKGDAILVPVFDGRERGTEVLTNVDEQGAEFYPVVDGDSLWGIAKKVYGKGHLWERIYEANRNLLKSPDDVRPGMELYIP